MKRKSYLIEILVGGLLLVMMTAVRFSYIFCYITAVGGDTGFLEMSMIRQGVQVPYLPNLLSQLYAYGLRLVFWLAGNKETAVVYVQAVLQILALFLLFLAYRKLCGIVFSAVVLLAIMFLEQGMRLMGDLNPGNLLLPLTCGYFLLFAAALKRAEKKNDNRFFFVCGFFFTGIYCGILAALDSFGLVIFLLSMILIGLVRKLPVGFLLGTAAGAGGIFLAKSAYFGLTLETPYFEYYQNYFTCENWNLFLHYGIESEALSLFAVLFLCAYAGFLWQQNKMRRAAEQEEKPSLPNLFISDVDSLPVPKMRTVEPAVTEENDVQGATDENGGSKEAIKKEIKYIENPLPVPKRHVKKEMTYAFVPDDAHMCFDINEIPGDSDFDVE